MNTHPKTEMKKEMKTSMSSENQSQNGLTRREMLMRSGIAGGFLFLPTYGQAENVESTENITFSKNSKNSKNAETTPILEAEILERVTIREVKPLEYHGWPTVATLPNGDLMTVVSAVMRDVRGPSHSG